MCITFLWIFNRSTGAIVSLHMFYCGLNCFLFFLIFHFVSLLNIFKCLYKLSMCNVHLILLDLNSMRAPTAFEMGSEQRKIKEETPRCKRMHCINTMCAHIHSVNSTFSTNLYLFFNISVRACERVCVCMQKRNV